MEGAERKEKRGGERFGFQWASPKKREENKKASKCALDVGGGRGAHKVVMFWLGLALASPSCLCSV